MSSDDLTHNLTDGSEDDKATQPTITAVFRLLRDLDKRLNGRLDNLESRFDVLESSVNGRFEALESSVRELQAGQMSLNSRFDVLESRLDRDFASVDARFAEMSDEMKDGLLRLSDKLCDSIDRTRVHAEADIENIARRLRKLESKAS